MPAWLWGRCKQCQRQVRSPSARMLMHLLSTSCKDNETLSCTCSWLAMSWTFLDLPPFAVRSVVAMLFFSFVIYALVLFQPGQVNALHVYAICTPVAECAYHKFRRPSAALFAHTVGQDRAPVRTRAATGPSQQ